MAVTVWGRSTGDWAGYLCRQRRHALRIPRLDFALPPSPNFEDRITPYRLDESSFRPSRFRSMITVAPFWAIIAVRTGAAMKRRPKVRLDAVIDLITHQAKPKLYRQGNIDFQITRGLLGISFRTYAVLKVTVTCIH